MDNCLNGKVVKEVRCLTKKELNNEGWHGQVLCVVFEDGTMIYPSRDEEGNGGGVFFGVTPGGEQFLLG